MTADVDDDALSWGDDGDPSYVPVAKPASETRWPVSSKSVSSKSVSPQPDSPQRERDPAVTAGHATAGSAEVAEPTRHTSSPLLVTYGILAGAFLIYTIGWIAPILGSGRTPNPDPLGEFMAVLSQVLAVASPAIWFASALLLTRGRRPIARLVALLVGLIVVLPWPFLLLGA